MIDRKPKVLLLIDEASVGGGQNHVLWLAEGLAGDGFQVAVACEARGYLVDELQSAGINHFSVEIRNTVSPKSFRALWKVVREFSPDIVHTHGGTAGLYGRIVGHLQKRLIVHTYHGIHYLHFEGFLKKYLYLTFDRQLLRWTNATICVAESDRTLALEQRLAKRESNYLIPNGISVERMKVRLNRNLDRRKQKSEKVIIGTIGRLHEQKGHKYFVEAAAELVKQLPNIEIRIIGDGDCRTQLQAQVVDLGLQDVIYFMGTRRDIAAQLSQMDVFVLPSLWEGMPFVLLEAMAAGVPIVATNVDGVSEILKHEFEGVLVPPRDPHALAEAIVKVFRNKKRTREIVVNAKKKIAAEFSIEKMVQSTESVYRSLVTTRVR